MGDDWGCSPIVPAIWVHDHDPMRARSAPASTDVSGRHPRQRTTAPGSVAWTLVFLAALAAVWAVVAFGAEIGDWWDRVSTTLTTADEFRAWVEGLGAWGPVAFFLAQATQVILVPIPGTLFPAVGSLAFGAWPALGLSLAGMALGSAVIFLVARRWGRPLAVRLVGEEMIHRYEHVMTARGGLLIWLVFLIPLLPDDALCALAGLSGISFRRFMVIATVGRIPAVAAGVFAMAGLEGAPAWVWILATGLGAVALWLGLRYRDALEAWLLRVTRRSGRHDTASSGSVVEIREDSNMLPGRGGDLVVHPLATLEEARTEPRDPLASVMVIVVATTSIAVVIGVVSGVSGLASGMILVWGTALAVLVSWARSDD